MTLSSFLKATALVVLALVAPQVNAEDNTPTPAQPIELSAVDSVKQVDSICLGAIVADKNNKHNADHFKSELVNQLTRQGFNVKVGAEHCDATISGTLEITKELVYSKTLFSP